MKRPSTRRRFLATAFAGVASVGSGVKSNVASGSRSGRESESETGSGADSGRSDHGQASDSTAGQSLPDAVGLEPLATGLSVPLDVAFAPDADRRYVADQRGLVHVHESDGLEDDPFLDLRDTVETGLEKGLLGIALHPEFAENRRAFVRYSAPRRPGTPAEYSHTFVLAAFEATADGRRAVRDSERSVLEIPQPQPNHNSGNVEFGPEGYLYVGVGDGGSGGDRGPGHVEDWYDANAGGNGQDVTENLLGSILRIDVDDRANGQNYVIPDDNPLVGTEGLDEHYAWGFRNPWGMSFEGDRLFVADVGQDDYEEVNLVESGGNYGWNVTEGAHCFTTEACPANTPERVREGEPLRDPILEYSHEDSIVSGTPGSGDYTFSGTSVTGGCVYRGSALSELVGSYVFADLNTGWRLFVATPSDDGGTWPIRTVESTVLDGEDLTRVFGFGRHDGELYVLGSSMRDSDDASSGGLYRLAPAP
jgi:glucose/arabinose dehydrogenase